MEYDVDSRSGGPVAHAETHKSVDGPFFRSLLEAALTWLKTNQQMVNNLNVYPVPDGDTGTNMVLTIQAAYNELANSGERNVGRLAHALAQGALMGARGNSGVILSQICRGFARALDNLDTMGTEDFARALVESRITAYKGVVRPVEGTILTVIKDVSVAVEQAAKPGGSLRKLLELAVETADESVKKTPELLPILAQAGVVDAGGKGLYFLLEGMLRHINGLPLNTPVASIQPLSAMKLEETIEIEPGQDYEVVIDFRPQEELDLEVFYNDLSQIGTSIQVGEGDGIYRMHIHVPTEKRYQPIDYTMKLGVITRVTIENLMAQMNDIEEKQNARLNLSPVEPGQIAVVAVSPGPGIARIFASLGVNAMVEGGQTMNPSTEDILHAFENLPTDKVIILPNNKNIILAAQAASEVTVKQVKVIPSRSVPQGLSAVLHHDLNGDLERVTADMNRAIHEVETGEITVATRSIEMNGVNVHQGEVIALLDGSLVMAANSLEEACLGLLQKASTLDKERITLFYGNNISRSEVNSIIDRIRKEYPSHEIELHEGGQPHYQFIIAIE